jgi:hypothetical protein
MKRVAMVSKVLKYSLEYDLSSSLSMNNVEAELKQEIVKASGLMQIFGGVVG